nr:DUF1150 family protein [Brucella pituitosa]
MERRTDRQYETSCTGSSIQVEHVSDTSKEIKNAPGLELWALFGASGEPIVLSDVRATALQGANEHELRTVMLH